MAMPTDNLSPPPAPSRVYYSLGRMLGVDDFQADQDYHRGSLARALLQLCGTGTVSGLNVTAPQVWQASTSYAALAFVYDASNNVQVNTGKAGISGASITFAAATGGTANDANGIVWTNQGPLSAAPWLPNTAYQVNAILADSNGNLQRMTASSALTSGLFPPVWNTAFGSVTSDGNPLIPAWTCIGPATLEIAVTPGLAIDRVGRMIEAPQTVCIYLQPWMTSQTASDLTNATHSGNILVDVFATFVPCTRGVTPCFATQDDYDATDAFSANRLLDSLAMQLVLRTDQNPLLPQDPWLGMGATPTVQAMKQNLLSANSGPAASQPFNPNGAWPAECPLNMTDCSGVFLARISIPTAAGSPGYALNALKIDNLSRLFLFPASLMGRNASLTSGTES